MQITDAKVIAGRLSKVRDIMKSEGVDIYVVVTGDYHISEYAGDYFKEREFITGFTGSAGTAVITPGAPTLISEKPVPSICFSACTKYLPSVKSLASSCVITAVPAEPVRV